MDSPSGAAAGASGFVRADLLDLADLDADLGKRLKPTISGKREREMQLRIPERRQAWEIDSTKLVVGKLIAKGSFGVVYRGTYDAQDVAIKLLDWSQELNMTQAKIASIRLSFQQEVAVWQKLDHPNVTKFVGACVRSSELDIPSVTGRIPITPDVCCVVVEYLAGGTLKKLLIEHLRKKLSLKTVIRLALDLSRGLNYLHSKKIVHRDVKSENVLLDKNKRLKIADFGVARVEALNPKDMTGATGTVNYMAPEVLDGKPYNRKCDVYSFGILLWEMYCCDMPFADYSFADMSYSVVHQNLRPDIPGCCPSTLADVMRKCWDANPDQRPNMSEVVEMLEKVDTKKGKGMTPTEKPGSCFCFS